MSQFFANSQCTHRFFTTGKEYGSRMLLGWVVFEYDTLPPSEVETLSANTIGAIAGLDLPPSIKRYNGNARYPWAVNSTSGGDQWEHDKPDSLPWVEWIRKHCIAARDADVVTVQIRLLEGNVKRLVINHLLEQGYVLDYSMDASTIKAQTLRQQAEFDLARGQFNIVSIS